MKGIKWQLEKGKIEDAIEIVKKENISLREELENHKKRISGKEDKTTIRQQILMLHYIGFLNNIKLPNTKKAKYLSVLLNKNEQEIREVLTYLNGKKEESNKIKSKENLEFVLNVFEELKMAEVIVLINKDIEKFK